MQREEVTRTGVQVEYGKSAFDSRSVVLPESLLMVGTNTRK